MTLPTGGIITYSYTSGALTGSAVGANDPIVCADGSAAGLQRKTPDTGTNYWNYSRGQGTGNQWTTTVTTPPDPSVGNDTVIYFQKDSNTTTPTNNFYETQRDSYQGAVSPSNLLWTMKTCYNGNTTNCTTTAVSSPITQRNAFTVLPSGKQSEHDDFWNTYGGATEVDDYDYGAAPHGSLLKKALATYASLGNITAFRQTVTTQNGSGVTVSKINYNYDETTPTATSGTPQHVSVPAPWGNLTSVNVYTNSTTYLTSSTTFYDTGNKKTITDVNGGLTTLNYHDATSTCGNAFPTSITEAVTTLSTSKTWNCTGAVQLTSVDENNQTTTTLYNDAYFWRPASVTDPTGAVRNFCYGLVAALALQTPTKVHAHLQFQQLDH